MPLNNDKQRQKDKQEKRTIMSSTKWQVDATLINIVSPTLFLL